MSLFPNDEGYEYEIRRSDSVDPLTEKPVASHYERGELASARHTLFRRLTHLPFDLTVDRLIEVKLSRPNSLRLDTEQQGGGRRFLIQAAIEYFPGMNRHVIATDCRETAGTMRPVAGSPTSVEDDDLIGGIEGAVDLLIRDLVDHDEFFRQTYRPTPDS